MRVVIWICLLWLFFTGCSFVTAVTRTEIVKTGLFEDDPEKIKIAALQVMKDQSLQDVKELGFDFDAPNVKPLGGPDAIRNALGDQAFQASMASVIYDPSRFQKAMEEFGHYQIFVFPYRHLVVVKDRIFINTQEIIREGETLEIKILFREKKVVYLTSNYEKIKQQESERAFLKGLFDLLEITGSARRGYERLLDKTD